MTIIDQLIAALFRIKANKALDRSEHPRRGLDHSCEPAVQRARGKTEPMRAPDGALDERIASDGPQDAPLAAGRVDIQATPRSHGTLVRGPSTEDCVRSPRGDADADCETGGSASPGEPVPRTARP